METEKTEGVVDTTNNGGEGTESQVENDTIAIPKSEYEKLNQTLGSLKRELKDYKKAKEEPKETPKSNQADESALLQKIERMSLRQANMTHEDDIALARNTAKKWGMDIDEVIADEDFKVKLEKQQTNRSNIEATSNIRSSGGKSQAKESAAYWVAKGVPPTVADIPDRKLRASIARQMMSSSKSSKKFYND
jgi:vacuolar-type H+-ATPase subunit I/STV1